MLGLLADTVQSGYDFATQNNPPVEMLAGLLGIPALQSTLNRMSYGEPLTTGRGMTTQLRPDTLDTLLMLSPSGAGAKTAAKGIQSGAKALSPQAERLLMDFMQKQGGLKYAITPETYMPLKQMSRQEFLGSPKIVGKSDAADLRPNFLKSTESAPLVPFMDGKYQARYSKNGATVFDGDKVIASYNFGDNLVVDPKYRKKGIAEELVYQQRTYFPEPAKARTRNKVSQKIQENVYDRIQRDLSSYDPTNGLLK